jgi:hypothetical protein
MEGRMEKLGMLAVNMRQKMGTVKKMRLKEITRIINRVRLVMLNIG